MGNFLDSITSGAAKRAAEATELAVMKKGKTPEQVRVIDFFMSSDSGDGCGCLKHASGTLTMQEYLTLVNNKITELDVKSKAITKIGLDESQISEIPPIVLYGFDFDVDGSYFKYANNMYVSNIYTVSWIFFSAEQIYIYSYTFDTMSDYTFEKTKDYFYTDVTSFTTEKITDARITSSVSGGGCFSKTTETTNKTMFVKNRFKIVVPNDYFSETMTDSPAIEQSIQAAKAMLREKKYSR